MEGCRCFMKEFLPWSKKTYNDAVYKYRQGRLSILDIQISGSCNYNCIYCDSPNRSRPCLTDFSHLESLLNQEEGLFNWVFVCGLGEPLWRKNKTALLKILSICEENGMKCSIFTNGSQIDDIILDYVKKGILFPLIKIDTFSVEKANNLYGTKDAEKTLAAIDALFNISKNIDSEYCHIAASIVPTSENILEIPDIVKKCLSNNVFPLIGQLECAGKSTGDNYNSLLLTKEELVNLKEDISSQINDVYKVPICPSVIAGIHIANDGWVSVDKRSGLSCSWFWLEEPQTVKLCNVNMLSSFSNADKLIINYRNEVYQQMKKLISNIEEYPFGGCGGNVRELAFEYVALQKELQ